MLIALRVGGGVVALVGLALWASGQDAHSDGLLTLGAWTTVAFALWGLRLIPLVGEPDVLSPGDERRRAIAFGVDGGILTVVASVVGIAVFGHLAGPLLVLLVIAVAACAGLVAAIVVAGVVLLVTALARRLTGRPAGWAAALGALLLFVVAAATTGVLSLETLPGTLGWRADAWATIATILTGVSIGGAVIGSPALAAISRALLLLAVVATVLAARQVRSRRAT